jgi:hypothetical protein
MVGWVVIVAIGLASITFVALGPRLKREQMRRRLGGTAGGSLNGIGAGFDAVWRPSAEEVHAQWEAQVELPAPAPAPGDEGRLDEGRIVIRLSNSA